MSKLQLKNIVKEYDKGCRAVDNFNLKIEDGQFAIFVGPSGCGKSTTLRMIAGLESITEGEIEIDGTVVNHIPSKNRDIAMVFQNYALYPHMSVFDNMAFGLKMRRMPKKEIRTKVENAGEILGLSHLMKRKPQALSGGERQRVAMGRAIVREPKVFLMDEPLSNLDAKLRIQTRQEIAALHKRLGTTFVYVTHDQTEAMTLGQKIVVMKDGIIMQQATPIELYNRPANMFVAGFIGTYPMNIFQGSLIHGVSPSVSFSGNLINIWDGHKKQISQKPYDKIYMGIRPEHISISSNDKQNNKLACGFIEHMEILGSEALLNVNSNGLTIKCRCNYSSEVAVGNNTELYINTQDLHFFDETEKSIFVSNE